MLLEDGRVVEVATALDAIMLTVARQIVVDWVCEQKLGCFLRHKIFTDLVKIFRFALPHLV